MNQKKKLRSSTVTRDPITLHGLVFSLLRPASAKPENTLE